MTPAQWEAQRRSFAYGNLKLHRPELTRADIDAAAERLGAEAMTEQNPNIHIGLCGQCRGNVTHDGVSVPRCEQCGAVPVAGPVLPMVPSAGSQPTYDQPPLVRDRKGRFRRPGEV